MRLLWRCSYLHSFNFESRGEERGRIFFRSAIERKYIESFFLGEFRVWSSWEGTTFYKMCHTRSSNYRYAPLFRVESCSGKDSPAFTLFVIQG